MLKAITREGEQLAWVVTRLRLQCCRVIGERGGLVL